MSFPTGNEIPKRPKQREAVGDASRMGLLARGDADEASRPAIGEKEEGLAWARHVVRECVLPSPAPARLPTSQLT